MKENTIFLLVLIAWLGLLIPLLVNAGKKTKPAAIIMCSIVLGPIIGWILYLILDDAKRAKQASAPQNTRGMHSEDPLEAWERQERAAAGPPPPPPSYKQQSPSA